MNETRGWLLLRAAVVVLVLATVFYLAIIKFTWVGRSVAKTGWGRERPDPAALLRNPPADAERVPAGEPIPRILHMTYVDRAKIPQKVHDNLRAFATGYDIRIAEDTECESLIAEHFTTAVLQRFRTLKGAHKADLYRYCALWVHGGVYCDIKTEHIMPLDQVVDHASGAVHTAIESLSGDAACACSVYQGFIATPPRHPLFLELIQFMVDVPAWVPTAHYLVFCQDMYERIRSRLGVPYLERGLNQTGAETYMLLVYEGAFNPKTERFECYDGLDRYGLCLFLTDPLGRSRIKVRYADYPWHTTKVERGHAFMTAVPRSMVRAIQTLSHATQSRPNTAAITNDAKTTTKES
jgi:hypothetical protein